MPTVPTPTPGDLAAFVGQVTGTTEVATLTKCGQEAAELVAQYLGTAALVVPDVMLRRAALAVAADLWEARKAPNGVVAFATPEGAEPVRVSRDPLRAARPLLAPWLGGGFA